MALFVYQSVPVLRQLLCTQSVFNFAHPVSVLEKLKTPLETIKVDIDQQCHWALDPLGHKPLGVSVGVI